MLGGSEALGWNDVEGAFDVDGCASMLGAFELLGIKETEGRSCLSAAQNSRSFASRVQSTRQSSVCSGRKQSRPKGISTASLPPSSLGSIPPQIELTSSST